MMRVSSEKPATDRTRLNTFPLTTTHRTKVRSGRSAAQAEEGGGNLSTEPGFVESE